MEIEHFSEYEHELSDQGLEKGLAPAGCEADQEIATREPCPECGGVVEFMPYSRYRGRNDWGSESWTYRAFVVCRKCDIATEF